MPEGISKESDTDDTTAGPNIDPEKRDRILKARQDKPADHGQPPNKELADAEGPGNQGDAASDRTG